MFKVLIFATFFQIVVLNTLHMGYHMCIYIYIHNGYRKNRKVRLHYLEWIEDREKYATVRVPSGLKIEDFARTLGAIFHLQSRRYAHHGVFFRC